MSFSNDAIQAFEIEWPVDKLRAKFENRRSEVGDRFPDIPEEYYVTWDGTKMVKPTIPDSVPKELHHTYENTYSEIKGAYYACLKDDEFLALGRAVSKAAKPFFNAGGEVAHWHTTKELDELQTDHGEKAVAEDVAEFEKLISEINRIGDTFSGEYDIAYRANKKTRQTQLHLLQSSIFNLYDKITEIPNRHKGSLRNSWVVCVNAAAQEVLQNVGYAHYMFDLLASLRAELENKRVARLTPEELAEEKKENEAAEAEFEAMMADEWNEGLQSGEELEYHNEPVASQFEIDELTMEIAVLKETVHGYETMIEQVSEILDSKGTLEEKFAEAQPLVAFAQSHYKFSKDTVAGVERHLLKPKPNGKPKDKDWQMGVRFLNNIKNPVNYPLTLHFRPQEEDGNNYQGHSRQMLALRTGIAVELWTIETIDIVILDRMSNRGNAVIAEIKHEGQSATAIVAVVIDAEGKPCIGTTMHLHDELWKTIERKAITEKQRYSNLPPAWFAKKHFEIQAAFDKNEKKASA